MATVANDKELTQCLAFAYFAEHPNYKEQNHLENYYRIFSEGGFPPNNPYLKYLSPGFNINKITKKSTLRAKITEEMVTKKDRKTKEEKTTLITKVKPGAHLQRYYRAVIYFCEKILPLDSLNKYKFVDQGDPFTQLVKDKCCEAIAKTFNINQKSDVLSPVDFFIVKADSMANIRETFQIFLKNEIPYSTVYNSFLVDFIDKKKLFPISHKARQTLTSAYVSRVESKSGNGKDKKDWIDPYIKFLDVILDNPSQSTNMIDKFIDFRFNEFNFKKLIWIYPLDFNYKKIINPKTKEPIYAYNVRFNLEMYTNSFNGKFDKTKSGGPVPDNWTGGLSPIPFQLYAEKYHQYGTLMGKLVMLRVNAFSQVTNKYTNIITKQLEKEKSEKSLSTPVGKETKKDIEAKLKLLKTGLTYQKEAARKSLLHRRLSVFYLTRKDTEPHTNKEIMTFFDSLSKLIPGRITSNDLFNEYRLNVINSILSNVNYRIPGKPSNKILNMWYSSAEMSYFLLEGGPAFHLHFKKCLFLSIHGAQTKKGFKYFKTDFDNLGSLRTAVKNLLSTTDIFIDHQNHKQQIKEELETPPHFVMS